jgi:hypothetical protein
VIRDTVLAKQTHWGKYGKNRPLRGEFDLLTAAAE